MKYSLRLLTGLYFALFVLFASSAYSKSNDLPFDLDFTDTEIVTASKEKEPAFKSAASVFVLSSDDIRRSGATNIPEALRLVPGIQVSRSGSSNWSVTSRGFGRLYDNKVLVMIDGRELYSSLFTGTHWDTADLILDDIDRIEVIRGTSSTLWGANTLNGVVNVITKKAQYTQGNHASITYGNQEKSLEYRRGGANKDNDIFYRAYAKKLSRNEVQTIDYLRGNQFEGAGDEWGMSKAGFRVDWQQSLHDEITFIGDAHDGKENQLLFIPSMEDTPVMDSSHVNGFNLDFKWKHDINKTDNTNLHIYLDNTSRKSQLSSIDRNIINIDGEYHLQPIASNKIKMGFGYRHTSDKMKDGVVGGVLVNEFTPNKEKTDLFTAFLQDTQILIPDTLDFTIGTKFEHHYITGSHFMPSAQLRWTPNKENTIWTSASKGIREPSKLETNLRRVVSTYGPYKVYWKGNPDFKEEKLVSYEVGYRNRSFSRLELDISAYMNEYENVRSFEPNFVDLQYELYNKGSAKTHGVDVSAKVNVLKNWNLVFGYSYFDMDLSFDESSGDTLSSYDAGITPHNQFQIQSRLNITKNIDFDASFYYVGDLHTVNIPSYKRTDLRVAWRPIKDLELSIVGQKLFYGNTRETTRPFYGTHNATLSNQVYGNVKWNF